MNKEDFDKLFLYLEDLKKNYYFSFLKKEVRDTINEYYNKYLFKKEDSSIFLEKLIEVIDEKIRDNTRWFFYHFLEEIFLEYDLFELSSGFNDLVDEIKKGSNLELINNFMFYHDGDTWDGCRTKLGQVLYEVCAEEINSRLRKCGFFSEEDSVLN